MWNAVKLGMSSLWPIIWAAVQPYLTSAGRKCLLTAKEYAAQAFTQDGWTDQEKFEFVRDRLRSKDDSWSDSLINRAIEMVLPYLKQHPADWI